ncbi:MAG: hypothetical protein SOS24_04635 [Clostridia bacterium]|nr:hypothetical protein [Clostridia bacterium]
MLNTSKTIRYTTTLPELYIDELKHMAQAKVIPSVNFAIRAALDEYLKQMKKNEYEAMLREAANDTAFMQRTLQCADDFSFSDGEVPGEW